MNTVEPETSCINCGGTEFRRVTSQVRLGDQVISGLNDLECTKCGALHPISSVLERVEILLRHKVNVRKAKDHI